LGIDKGPLSCGVQKEVIGNCTELANSSAKVLGVVKLFLKSTAESANVRSTGGCGDARSCLMLAPASAAAFQKNVSGGLRITTRRCLISQKD